jgi:hypothetical protein
MAEDVVLESKEKGGKIVQLVKGSPSILADWRDIDPKSISYYVQVRKRGEPSIDVFKRPEMVGEKVYLKEFKSLAKAKSNFKKKIKEVI